MKAARRLTIMAVLTMATTTTEAVGKHSETIDYGLGFRSSGFRALPSGYDDGNCPADGGINFRTQCQLRCVRSLASRPTRDTNTFEFRVYLKSPLKFLCRVNI